MQKIQYVPAVNADVIFARRKGTRNIRLSVKNDGVIRLTIPFGVSERQAIKFLASKADWVNKHVKPQIILRNGDHIGKSYRLALQQGAKRRSRIGQNEILVRLSNEETENPEAQLYIKQACDRALKKEAERLLPQRLATLANQHDFQYKSLKIKKFKSRWGSCDNHNNIMLNSYLTQLPWDLIDYVILHELTHTRHKHHQASFWEPLAKLAPDYKEKRKQLRAQPTDITPTSY